MGCAEKEADTVFSRVVRLQKFGKGDVIANVIAEFVVEIKERDNQSWFFVFNLFGDLLLGNVQSIRIAKLHCSQLSGELNSFSPPV